MSADESTACACGCAQLAKPGRSYIHNHHWRRDPEQRFWSRVDKGSADECWLWTDPLSGGYGRLWVEGERLWAHRYAYELLVGPIPPGLTIDHVKTRGCTSRACVNPAHLEPVTLRENLRRAGNQLKTHCPQGHPYDAENTYVGTKGTRFCRACHRESERRRRERVKDVRR